MLFLARDSRMLKALCDGALSWWSTHDLSSHNSCLSHTLTASNAAEWLCKCADWWFGLEVRTLWTTPLTSRKQSTSLWLGHPHFFGLGDVGLFHSRLSLVWMDCTRRSMTCSSSALRQQAYFGPLPAYLLLARCLATLSMRESPVRRAKKPC